MGEGSDRSCGGLGFSSDTFAGRSGLRLLVPTGSCLLGAGHGQGSLITTQPFSAGWEPKGCVSPRASVLLTSTSVDHGASCCGEMARSALC